MGRRPTKHIGTMAAVCESSGAPVVVEVYRELVAVQYSEGTRALAEGMRIFKLHGEILRVDGEDTSYLTNGSERYKMSEPL